MPAQIFISYRKMDTLTQAGRLHDSLNNHFGRGSVFYDNENLEPGEPWPESLEKNVKEAKIVLLLCKDPDTWLGKTPTVPNRIDDPEDWVRKEIETALQRNKIIIPVLFGEENALPAADDMPDSLKSIVDLQNHTIRETHWNDDVKPLVQQLEKNGVIQNILFLNTHLTQNLVEAIAPYNEKALRLSNNSDWLAQPDNLRKVQQFVFQNFVGEIGKQLRKLVNIGDDREMSREHKEQAYVKKCLDITRSAFELVNYTLLSVIWDKVKSGHITLLPEEKAQIKSVFETEFMLSLRAQQSILGTLSSVFSRHPSIPFPFREQAADFFTQTANGHALEHACTQLEGAQNPPKIDDAENQLAEILKHFAFLSNYRMVSLKEIAYLHWRNGEPEYLHRYVSLGIDVRFSEDSEKGHWTGEGEQTPAVLLYRGDNYRDGINLFPFVIDYNALTFEQGAKICFLSSRDLQRDNALEYRFLADNSRQHIEKPDTFHLAAPRDELMMDKEKLKTYNLAGVVDGFHQARAVLTDADNFFDNL